MTFKITKEESISMVIHLEPNFKKSWDQEIEFWGTEIEKAGLCTVFGGLGSYLLEKIKYKNFANLKQLFQLIEDFILNGDEEVGTAATTGFLEALLHQSDEEPNLSEVFVPLLGRESKKYCIAYNKFCGVKNKGL